MDRTDFKVITMDAMTFFAWLENHKDQVLNQVVVFDYNKEDIRGVPRTGNDLFNVAVIANGMEILLSDQPEMHLADFQTRVKSLSLTPMIGRLNKFI